MIKRLAAIVFAALGLFALAAQAAAQQYPARTITIVVPYPAGGPTDTTAREIARGLSDRLKQNVIVENVTGGGTIIATNKVARADPDGYTLLLHNLQISANATLYKNLPFDTEKDLTTVMLVNKNPLVLLGRNTLKANDFKGLLALMKKQTLKAAIPGYGATGHLATTLLAQETKTKIDEIPYRGSAPAMTDLMGGHVDLFIATPQAAVPQVKAGKLKAYAVTSTEKLADLPTAAPLATVLGPKFDIIFWQALFAPAKTPDAVLKKLNATLQEVVADPALVKRWKVEGFDAFPKNQQSIDAGRAFLKSEIERWGKVIRDNNIKVNQ
ncbi:MAG TPA: tripartite tricarboxylate transporter substrate-binding protein [Pseudolabrys sp.]|jgi:tripartite-type tricarboxylate transporter receptor subunit TctC|nr:tripartite tricarboxylate transporter substrate-binding protein [Pseudolabrys sp.]